MYNSACGRAKGESAPAAAVDCGGVVYNVTQNKDVTDQSRWGLRGKLRYAQGALDLVVIADYPNENSNFCWLPAVAITFAPSALPI